MDEILKNDDLLENDSVCENDAACEASQEPLPSPLDEIECPCCSEQACDEEETVEGDFDDADVEEAEEEPAEIVVSVNKLFKDYGKLIALNGIDLTLTSGKIVGLLGPNGSGKTTLIKILSGLLTATYGDAKICGYKIGEETKALVSYLPERPYFSSWMKVEECLKFFEDFYMDFDRELAEKMLIDLEIDKTKKLRTLSKGTKEKVQLILVMSRRAKLYLLDEPIAGVDPAARDYILETIISAYNREATVLISTHLISDIENVLDEYIFIKKGDIVEHGNAKNYAEKNGETLDMHFREVFKYVR